MFESPQEQVPDSKVGVWIGVAVVVIIAVALGYYVSRKPGSAGSGTSVVAASTSANSAAGSDATKDLRVTSVQMEKDYTGTTAQWLVDIKNDSQTYTYSNIGYETTYIGAGGNVLLVNHGKINVSIGPGEDQNAQFRDALYPNGTSVYRVKITGADASQ